MNPQFVPSSPAGTRRALPTLSTGLSTGFVDTVRPAPYVGIYREGGPVGGLLLGMTLGTERGSGERLGTAPERWPRSRSHPAQ